MNLKSKKIVLITPSLAKGVLEKVVVGAKELAKEYDVTKLDLNEGDEKWVDTILSYLDYDRKSHHAVISEKGIQYTRKCQMAYGILS